MIKKSLFLKSYCVNIIYIFFYQGIEDENKFPKLIHNKLVGNTFIFQIKATPYNHNARRQTFFILKIIDRNILEVELNETIDDSSTKKRAHSSIDEESSIDLNTQSSSDILESKKSKSSQIEDDQGS